MKLTNLLTARVLKKITLWTLSSLVVFTVFGFLLLPLILKAVLTSQLTKRLHREVTIEKIQLNPFTLLTQVNGFAIKDGDGANPFVSFEGLAIDFQAASLFKRGPVVRDLVLTAPHVTIIRNEDLTYNFSDLLEEFAAKPTPGSESPPETKPLQFSLNNIRIEGGSIDFEDRPKHARHEVRDLNIGIPFLSDLPYDLNVYVQPAFEAKVNGTPIVLTGKTKPFSDSRETALDVNIHNSDIAKYLEYIPAELRFKVTSGILDTKVALSFTQYKDKPPTLIVNGQVGLNKLSVTDLQDRSLLNLPSLTVAIDSTDILAKKVNLATILLQSPEVHLWRDKTGIFNLTSLVPEKQGTDGTKSDVPESTPLNIEVAELRLTDGKVTFADESVEKPFQTTLDAINVVVNHFSNAPTKPAAVEVSLKTDAGETIQHTGTLTLNPLKVEGTVELHKIPAKRYVAYYEKRILFDVEDALLDLSTHYVYTKSENNEQTSLTGLTATLSSLRLKKQGEKEWFLNIPTLSLKDADLDLTKQTLLIGEVSTSKGAVAVKRESNGAVNLQQLLPGSPIAKAVKKGIAFPQPQKEAPSTPWLVVVKKITADGYTVKMEDKVPTQPVVLTANPINLVAENFSTEKNNKVKTSLRLTVNKTGTLAVTGPVSMSPLSASLKVEAKGIDLVPLQPYFADKVKITLTKGAASADGNLTLQATPENTMKASFSGQASLTKFATIDKKNAEDFLTWNALSLNGVNVGTDPLRVEISEVAVSDFYSRLIVNPDATLNVQGITQNEAQPSGKIETAPSSSNTAATQKPGEAATIKIAKVTLRSGTVYFSDHYIKPNYSAKLTQLGGRVSALSSEKSDPADVDLHGKLDDGAPFEITGKINPFSRDLYVDLTVDFKDIDLNPMTPYVGKYAGYTVEKGKLSLNLKYLIANRKLQAENKVFLDQFTFGDETHSPDATALPVRLAVSLLKDRNGAINLDLPVTGSLDDPQFSVWSVIVKILTNLLAKAATSPFALLGAAFGGGGEEFSRLEFAYGRADLDSQGEEKLKKLVSVLAERPALKLEVSGYVDTEKDTEGLRQYLFERKLKAQKFNETVEKGTEDASLDEVKIESDEYSTYLAKAYKKEAFDKPRNILGLAKSLPDDEMEKLMLTNIQVTDEELHDLAKRRVLRVEDYLLKSGQIEAGRIFLVEPKSIAQKSEENIKGSRVDFAIK